jgi:uncharacterized protein YndB with AHSA1/START domain
MGATQNFITVQTTVNAPIEKVWEKWNNPDAIVKWNNASDDWHTTKAENDLRIGGKFLFRMEAKDGSAGFDFIGTYNNIKLHEIIEYTMEDGRTVKILFSGTANSTKVVETFVAETVNSIEIQQGGWQAILDSFKKYAETN